MSGFNRQQKKGMARFMEKRDGRLKQHPLSAGTAQGATWRTETIVILEQLGKTFDKAQLGLIIWRIPLDPFVCSSDEKTGTATGSDMS